MPEAHEAAAPGEAFSEAESVEILRARLLDFKRVGSSTKLASSRSSPLRSVTFEDTPSALNVVV